MSYEKLWELLIDHIMNKSDLAKKTKTSFNTMARLDKNESVSMDILVRICSVFQCDIEDIVEAVDLSDTTNTFEK